MRNRLIIISWRCFENGTDSRENYEGCFSRPLPLSDLNRICPKVSAFQPDRPPTNCARALYLLRRPPGPARSAAAPAFARPPVRGLRSRLAGGPSPALPPPRPLPLVLQTRMRRFCFAKDLLPLPIAFPVEPVLAHAHALRLLACSHRCLVTRYEASPRAPCTRVYGANIACICCPSIPGVHGPRDSLPCTLWARMRSAGSPPRPLQARAQTASAAEYMDYT